MRLGIRLLLVVAVAAGMAACAKPGDAGSGNPADSGSTPALPGQQRLNEIADGVREQGTRDFPEVYAGVEVRTEEGKVIVYRVPSRRFDSAFAARVVASEVRMVDAAHSERELTALVQRIQANQDQLAAEGIPLNSLAARYDGTCVELGTTEVEKAKTWLAKRYTGQPICVELRGPAATW